VLPLGALGAQVARTMVGENPIKKVVTLLEEMSATLGTEAKKDKDIFTKMDCWCLKSRKKMTAEVEAAQKKIDELDGTIETQTGIIASATQEIKNLKEFIAKSNKELNDSADLRKKEKAEAEGDQADFKETAETLTTAIGVLGKAQNTGFLSKSEATSLLQIRSQLNNFGTVMQKDLWDMLGSFTSEAKTGFLQQEPRDYTKGPEGANDLSGNAAGVKSYNNRSGAIFGMLKQMKDDFEKQLADSIASEAAKEDSFAKLKATKMAEIKAAKEQKVAKDTELGQAKMDKSNAETEKKATVEALGEDREFLVDMEKKCKDATEGYKARATERSLEQKAVGEAISILTSDEAREIQSKTYKFVQLSSESIQRKRAAVMTLMQRAKSSSDVRLGSYAIMAQLDKFPHAKKALNDLLGELKAEQKQEFATRDQCIADLTASDNKIADLSVAIEDLEAEIGINEQTIETCNDAIKALDAKVAETQQAIADATEARTEENAAYVEEVNNQKLTVEVLDKAMAKLEAYYGKLELFQQAPPPEGAASLSEPVAKNQAAPGVIGLLKMIKSDAEHVIKTAGEDEQRSEQEYTELVAAYNKAIKTDKKEIAAKTEEKSAAIASKETNGQQLDSDEMEKQVELTGNKGLHDKCDFLMKNFQQTQDAREQDMESIQMALQILDGAKFD